jgi:hypothetical protein
MQAHIDKVKELIFLIREYGSNQYFKKHPQAQKIEDQKAFFSLANEGMKKAQLIILKQLKANLADQKDTKDRLKTQRKTDSKNKAAITTIENEIKTLEFIELIYRHLMNSIVWQIFGAKREVIARHHLEEGGSKSLEGPGFDAVVIAANKINADPLKFALISDMTTNIHVGDLVIWTPDGLEISEVKTGDKNKQAIDLFKFYEVNDLNPVERVEQMPSGHFKDQLKRMLKQKETNKKTANIINNDKGVYQKDDNTTIYLRESYHVETTYHDVLEELIEKSKERDWAFTSIEGILNVGVYRNDWRLHGNMVLRQLNEYPIYDLRGTMTVDISEPIFMKPFPDDMLTDIAFGKVRILINIDYDKLIEFANNIGLFMRWSTSKEFASIAGKLPMKSHEIFSFKNKGLVIDYKGQLMFIGMGFISRLIFDHKTPQVQLINRLIGIEQADKN